MTVSSIAAAKTLGQFCNWDISNLQMQKMLYFAHMFYIGRGSDEPLISEQFEAWDYGPVLPSLYRFVKFFGSENIVDIFPGKPLSENSPEGKILKEVAEHLAHRPPSQLVRFTHHEDGAWACYYKPNRKGIKIPDSAILEEYKKLYA